MPLTQGKRTITGAGRGLLELGVAAAAACLQGGLAMLSSGYARPARVGQGATDALKMADVATSRVVGLFLESQTGTATDGEARIDAQAIEVLCKNSTGANAITVADIGTYCFVMDDETVSRVSAGGVRARAGVVLSVDATGVMVAVSPIIAAAAPRVIHIPFYISETDTLAGTVADIVSPVSGRISRMTVIVQKAVTTGGDVTVTTPQGAVAGLACTVADAAAKGTVVTDTPTLGDATTIVNALDRIQITPGAPFATAGAVSGILEIAY